MNGYGCSVRRGYGCAYGVMRVPASGSASFVCFNIKPYLCGCNVNLQSMEEKNLTPEEAFYIDKVNLEREITNRVKQFAGTHAINVEFACKVEVEFMNTTEGGVEENTQCQPSACTHTNMHP